MAPTTDAVDQLLQVITERLEPAREVLKKIKPPAQRLPRRVALEPLAAQLRARKGRVAALLYAFRRNIVRPRHGQADWHERVRRVERRLADQDQVLEEARQLLRAQATRDKNDKLFDKAEWGVRILQANDRSSEEQAREALRKAAGERFNEWEVPEQLLRGALVLWSDDLARALKTAGEEFGHVIKAYQLIAQAKLAAAGELGSLVAEQPPASQYEMYHFIEDNARKSAIRMGTVGLAFSGGGIRSATFNLGFLQGAAALGLLTRFDYLSTVSGGGYIGAWFAAWVRREGGLEPKPWTEDDVKRESVRLSTEEQKKTDRRGWRRCVIATKDAPGASNHPLALTSRANARHRARRWKRSSRTRPRSHSRRWATGRRPSRRLKTRTERRGKTSSSDTRPTSLKKGSGRLGARERPDAAQLEPGSPGRGGSALGPGPRERRRPGGDSPNSALETYGGGRARTSSSPPRAQQLPRPQGRSVVDRHLDDGFGLPSQPFPQPVHRAADAAGIGRVAAVGAVFVHAFDIGQDDPSRPNVAGPAL